MIDDNGTQERTGWAGLIDRLPEKWFAPEPEPAQPKPDTSSPFLEYQQHELDHYNQSIKQKKAFHDETSKTIRRIFYGLAGASLFCIVTVFGKSDIELLASNVTVTLPILNYPMDLKAFLVVGPLFLIALTVYLHIFVGQHRLQELAKNYRQPTLANFDERTPQIATALLFYWMVPLTLAVFTWKVWPGPAGPYLFWLTLGLAAVMVWLQMRRLPREFRCVSLLLLPLALIFFVVVLHLFTNSRHWNLSNVDLSGQDLRGNNMAGADLTFSLLNCRSVERDRVECVNLSFANLESANLKGADLTGANLSGANLNGADLSGAELNGANLTGAKLNGAILSKAELNGAVLSRAELTMAYLDGAQLNCYEPENGEEKCVDLSDAVLNGANLSGAELVDADLSGAELNGANLSGADLTNANLGRAKLNCMTQNNGQAICADLSEAELYGATWLLAQLIGADLTGTNISQTWLNTTCGDRSTKLPRNRTIPSCGF